MELALIDPKSKEWEYMWEWLEKHPINKGLDNPSLALNEGEAWQYLGSYKQKERVVHSFRHRLHPITKGIKNLSVSASKELTPEQISKTFRL